MKRINILLMLVLAAAVGVFGAYLLWIHNALDTVGPVITFEEEILEISVEDPENALLQGVHAQDDRDGDVTASLLVESVYGINEDNQTLVTYAAFDRAGNVTKQTRVVCYRDYESPRFELYASLSFPGGREFDLLDYVGAKDLIEGDIRRRVRATLVSDTKSINLVGNHTVRFQVTNSLGDTVVAELPVEVYDPEWYTASVKLSEYLVYLQKGDHFDPEDYLESFVVRGDAIDVSRSIPEDVLCTIEGNVSTREPGVYKVSYTLSKNLNLTSFSGHAVLIVIVQE